MVLRESLILASVGDCDWIAARRSRLASAARNVVRRQLLTTGSVSLARL